MKTDVLKVAEGVERGISAPQHQQGSLGFAHLSPCVGVWGSSPTAHSAAKAKARPEESICLC